MPIIHCLGLKPGSVSTGVPDPRVGNPVWYELSKGPEDLKSVQGDDTGVGVDGWSGALVPVPDEASGHWGSWE